MGGDRVRGTAAVVAGVAMVSADGVVIRLLDKDPWSVLALRSPGAAVSLLLIARFLGGRPLIDQFRSAGWLGLGVTAASMSANLLWVAALTHTAVANVLAIYAGAPLFVALLGWFLLRERLAGPTWLALVLVTAAVLGLLGSGVQAGRLAGDVAALFATLSMALAITLMRRARIASMIPAMAMSHTLVSIIALGPASPSTFSAGDLAMMLAYGLLFLGPGIALLTYAPRLIPAGEVGLVLPLEAALGTFLAWVVLSEAPSAAALAGGAAIIATLVVHSRWSLRRDAEAPLLTQAVPAAGDR